jgi:maltose alpha-D-glucosyltransferase/alpha-amylase
LQEAARRAAGAGATLEDAVARCAQWPATGVKTRVHGDLRLQELLLVHNDFVVIDFEGDPDRPLEERRAKQSPLRDLAALLHSFEQARVAALRLGAHSEGDVARRESVAQAWAQSVRQAFLQAYGEAAVAGGLYPDEVSFTAARPLLDLFEIDRALSALRDELERRAEASGTAFSLAVLAGT